MSEALETIVDEAGTVTVGGEQLEITALKIREIPPFARALQPVMEPLASIMGRPLDVMAIAKLAADGEGLIDAVSIACRKPLTWVGELEPDDFILLALAVLEVNADFFAQRLMPVLMDKIARLDQAGLMPGSDSSQPAILDG